MTPETWADVGNWLVLALGAAMAGGTGVALLSYRRTGLFPGQPIDDEGNPVGEVSVGSAVTRVVVGAVLVLWGLAGLVAGSFLAL